MGVISETQIRTYYQRGEQRIQQEYDPGFTCGGPLVVTLPLLTWSVIDKSSPMGRSREGDTGRWL